MRTLEELVSRISNNYSVYQEDVTDEQLEYLTVVQGFKVKNNISGINTKDIVDETWHRSRPDTYSLRFTNLTKYR